MKTSRKTSILLVILSLFFFSRTSAQAARLFQEDDPVRQCAEGVQYYLSGQYSKAFPLVETGFINRDKTTFSKIDDLGECALVLGRLFQDLAKTSKALEAEYVALKAFKSSGNQYYVSVTLQDIGIAYRAQGRYAEALESQQQALVIMRELGDREGEGAALANIGVVYYSQGKFAEALESNQEALAIAREVGDRANEGYTLSYIALIYDSQGRHIDALENYQQALAIMRELGDRQGEGITLDNIGVVYHAQGKLVEALENHQQALAIAREVGDRASEGSALSNICSVYNSQGLYAKALERCQQALAIAREVGDPDAEGAALNSIGLIYKNQGQDTKALENYDQALTIARELGDLNSEASTLYNMCSIYILQERYAEALENFQQALDIFRRLGNRDAEGSTLNGIGLLFEQQGQYAEALDAYQQALIIAREVGDQGGEANTLGQIGTIYHGESKYAEALDSYQQALEIARELGYKTIEARMLSNIGAVHDDEGRYAEALDAYQKAITIHEEIRATAGSESARASYIEGFAFIYTRAIELYYRGAQPEDAFLTTERGRARAFLDSIATGYVELSDKEDVALLNQEREAYAKRQVAQFALIKAKMDNPSDEKLIAELEVQLTQAETDYETAVATINATSNRLEQLIQGRSKVLDVSEIQNLLDDKTTIISFWILGDSVLGFIIDRENFHTVSLNISEAELFFLVNNFRNFPDIQETHSNSMIELYNALIVPLKPYLRTEGLIIIPHGILHYLSFGGLTDGQHYLMDEYVITYLPSASTLPFIQQNAQEIGGQPLIIGNPTTGNYDSTASFETERDNLGPLPFAEEEAKDIAIQLGVQPYLENEAKETLVRQKASQAIVLHLAAHGVINPTTPLSSFIALAPDLENDGWLTVGEIYGLELDNTDLVVLSACDTQIGQLTTGDEFVGLTRALFFAGAPTVVASLWSVDDKSTGLLMESFYMHMKNGMGKAEALRQAQTDVREKYPSPYYWAGFVLNGNGGKLNNSSAINFQTNSSTLNFAIIVGLFCCGGLFFAILLYIKSYFSNKRKIL